MYREDKNEVRSCVTDGSKVFSKTPLYFISRCVIYIFIIFLFTKKLNVIKLLSKVLICLEFSESAVHLSVAAAAGGADTSGGGDADGVSTGVVGGAAAGVVVLHACFAAYTCGAALGSGSWYQLASHIFAPFAITERRRP